MRPKPQRTGMDGRIDPCLGPPCGLIARAMDLVVMASAQRYGEFIARLATKRAMLGKAQMMGICGHAAADQAWLLGYEPDVVFVADPAWLGAGQLALVDAGRDRCSQGFSRPAAA